MQAKGVKKMCLFLTFHPPELRQRETLICVCCATAYTVLPWVLEDGFMGVSFTSNAYVSSSASLFPSCLYLPIWLCDKPESRTELASK